MFVYYNYYLRLANRLVSGVMPTTARRRLFVPQAIRYFQRQDYPNKELLVVGDLAGLVARSRVTIDAGR